MGIRDEDFEKLREALAADLADKFNFIVLDVPNAYLERFVLKVKELRALCPKHTIIAGNCVTNEITEEILLRMVRHLHRRSQRGVRPSHGATWYRFVRTHLGVSRLSQLRPSIAYR